MARSPSNPQSYTGNPPAIPGKPFLHSFPTPNLDDRIFIVRKDTRYGGFEMPSQGDTFIGPNAEKYSDFVFATAQPTDTEGWVNLFYLNERDNQDDYNFEVAYPYVDRDYPQYTRTYVVLRDDTRANEPQADAVDPVHSDLKLVDHKWIRLQDPVIDALFIGIQRVYERLPSPVITSYGLNQYQQEVTSAAQEDVTPAFPSISELTEDVKIERTGTAKAKLTTSTVDTLFPATLLKLEREDRILPFKFRTKVPMETDTQVVAGTATLPVLGQDDWVASEQQITDFKKQVSREFRSTTLPVTLVDYKINQDQQLVTVTDTWDNGLQTLTPDAYTPDASVENLGNDESIKSVSTIDGPFPHAVYRVQVPDPTPEKFRFAIPIETTEITSIGTASMATLATGELEHAEEQQSVFWKRVTSSGREAASLPVTLISYKFTQDKQIETVTETYDAGLQDLSDVTARTVEGTVENLGNSTSLKIEGAVPSLFTEAKYGIRIPDAIPERFRVAVPTETISLLSDGTAAPPTLGTGDLSITDEQVNVFTKRTTTETRAGVTLPISLISYKLTQDKQIETVTETYDSGLQTISGVTELTVEADVQNLGNNTSLLSVGEVSSLFTDAKYGTRIPDAIPERFRVAVPTETISLLSAGTAAPPTLGTGDLSITSDQVNEFVVRTTTETRAGVTLPITLTSYKVTPEKQLETVLETYDSGLQTISITARTVEGDVQNLGNNTSLKSQGTVPDLFTDAKYGTRIPDAVPERFRVAVPTSTISLLSDGTAAPPTLGTGDLSITEDQVNEFTKRTTTETRAGVTLPITLTSYKLTQDKQVETMLETYDSGLQTITGVDELTTEAEVQNLGNNTSLLSVGTVADLFTDAKYGTRIPDAIPERFRVAVPTETVSLLSAGSAAPPTLGTGDLSITEDQVNEFVKRTTTETRAGVTLPITLTSYKITPDKQVETMLETYDSGLQTITPTARTVEGDVQNLGNNTSLKAQGTVPDLFTDAKYAIKIPDAVPERFRVAVPTSTVSLLSDGTAAPPTLGTGDLSITEDQVNEFTKRTTTETRAGISLPVTLISYKLTQDKQVETVTETYDAGLQTITGVDELTVEASVENLGNNTSLLSVGEVADLFTDAKYATRIPDAIPERFRVAVPTSTVSLLSAGSAAPPVLGTGDLSISEDQINEFVKRTTTETRAGVTLPITLTSYKMTPDKQLETMLETYDAGLQTLSLTARTVEADVQNLGNNTSLKAQGTVPDLFTDAKYGTRIPDAVPERFRVAVPTSTVSLLSDGTAAPPTLGTGDLSITEDQVNEFTKRTTTETRAGVSLPVTLTSYKLTQDKQVETVLETYDAGLQTITGVDETTVEASVENLGNNTSLLSVGTVSGLFADAKYGIRIPDAIPERFRVAVPTETVSFLSPGSATPPTLGTGDLSITEDQVNEFVKRTTTETRAGVTLPITLTSYKMTADKQLETMLETYDSGLQTLSLTARTVEADVQNLGNNTSLKAQGTVADLFTDAKYGTRIPDAVPERFRVAVPTATVSILSDGTASPPTLGTGDLSITEDQVNEFTKRTTTETRAGVSLPVTLLSYKLTQDKQIETLTETYDAGIQTITGVDELTVEAAVENLGNNTSLLSVGEVPALFTDAKYATRIPDAIPERFRVAVPTETISLLSAGSAAPPTLGTGDLSISEDQINEFVKRTTTETRAGVTLPITLTSYKITPDKQVETMLETYDSGLQTITPTARTVEGDVQNLGNNTSLKAQGTVPDLFTDAKYGTRIPDAVPERFRVAVPTSTVSILSDGTASPPTLGTGDLSITEDQINEFTKRTTTETRAGVSLPVTLTSYRLTREKQIETVLETYDSGLQTISGVDELTTEAEVQNLGNNTSLLSVGTVADLFTDAKYATRIPDAIPERFRVAVPTSTVSVLSAGTAAPPTLGTGDLSISEDQQTEFVKRTTTETRAGISLPITLVSYKMTQDKQVETLTETYDSGLQTLSSLSELTIEANVENLGNNTSLKAEGTVSSLFSATVHQRSRPDSLWPEKFRAGVPLVTTTQVVAGTAADPTLGTGDVSAEERQLDAYTKRTSLATRGTTSFPTTPLDSQEYDQSLDVVIPFTEYIDAAGTNIGDNRKIVEAQGDGTEYVKTFDITDIQAALDNYLLSFPGTANLQLPDILESITAIMEATSGDGSYDESGSAGWQVVDSGGSSASLSIRGTGQASAAIIPDLAISIRQVWANNVPTIHYLFFLPLPVAAADVATKLTALVGSPVSAWPRFNPLAHTFVLSGQRLSLQCTASSNWHQGGSFSDSGSSSEFAVSSGTGFSHEVGLTVRTVRIPPTIHGAIAIDGVTTTEVDINADAQAITNSVATIFKSGTVRGSIYPTTLAATPNANEIPATGKYIVRVDADPYRWGYAKIHAEVVDFADLSLVAGDALAPPTPTSGPAGYVGNLYIRFWVQFRSVEIATADADSGDFVHFFDGITPLFGMAYDFATSSFIVKVDGQASKFISKAVAADTWYQIDFRLSNVAAGLPVNLTTSIDNVNYATANATIGDGITINTMYAGQYNAPVAHAVDSRFLFKFQIGTHPGDVDIFDGQMNGTVVPPFDSRVGTGTSIVNSFYMKIMTGAGVDSYAIKNFGDQVF